jgi:hypothetical protein
MHRALGRRRCPRRRSTRTGRSRPRCTRRCAVRREALATLADEPRALPALGELHVGMS